MTYHDEIERIERLVEAKFNSLDRRLLNGQLSQAEYDELAKCICAWCDAEYDRAEAYRKIAAL